MNRGIDRVVSWLAVFCLTLVTIVVNLRQIAVGQEELPPPLPRLGRVASPHYDVLIDPQQRHAKAIVIVTHVPLVGHVFQNGGGPTCCEELLEKLGADGRCQASDESCTALFNFHGAEDFPHARQSIVLNRVWLQPGDVIDTREVRGSERRLRISQFEVNQGEGCDETSAKFLHAGCPAATGECPCGSDAKCSGECLAAHRPGCQCDDCQCAGHVVKSDGPNCGEDCAVRTFVLQHAEAHDAMAEFHPLKLMEHIAGLMAEKAAAQAALEARQEGAEQFAELYEAMAELAADNAALDARLAAHEENQKLLERISDLAADNARLKAHAELADQRVELGKATAALTLENERLKLRLASLEQKQADQQHAAIHEDLPVRTRVIAMYPDGRVEVQEESTRTAAKPRTDQNSR